MRLLTLLIFLLPISGFSATTPLAPSVTNNAALYYQIGGARVIPPAATSLTTTVGIGGSIEGGLGYSCGKFDPKASIRHTLNNLKSQIVTIGDGVTAAISGLPGYIVCRANNLACQMFQNNKAAAEKLYQVSVKSCEEIEAAGARGENPFSDWIKIRKVQAWKREAAKKTDAVTAKRNVAKESGREGVAWSASPTGRAGGAGQPSLNPVADGAQIGYNLLLERDPSSTAPAPTNKQQTRLAKTWPSPADIQRDATNILGDRSEPIQDGQAPRGRPGLGLTREVETLAEQYRLRLMAMVTAGVPDKEPFPVPITSTLLESLTNSPDWLVDRIANEAALAGVIDRALLLRRVFLVALSDPNTAAATPAADEIRKKVAQLEDEVDRLMFEQRVRKELTHQTSSTVVERHLARQAGIVSGGQQEDEAPLENGAVKTPDATQQ